MTFGGISSINSVLARINAIENNFSALGVNVDYAQSTQKSDFQTVLNSKIKESEDLKAAQTPEEIEENILEKNLDDEIEGVKKQALNLKSKIDIKSQNSDIDEIIQTFADKYEVDSDFIKAIIKQESGFNERATSKKGAMGLMQLMPSTAKSLGVTNAYDPWENVEGGVKHIKNLLTRYDGNKELALAAYNAGMGAVKKYGGIPPYKETNNYVNSIMTQYNKVKGARI